MALTPPAPRGPIHHRRIDCRGYWREDGLWDIEAHLTDVKSYPFANAWRGEIGPGEACATLRASSPSSIGAGL